MQKKTKILVGAAATLLIAGSAVGFASASGEAEDGPDAPLAGNDLQRATAAALAYTGGGEVIETEVGDDGAAYGVEVRLADGSVVEVTLDGSFHVTGQSTDDDGAGDDG